MTPEELIKRGFYLFPLKGKSTPLVKWREKSSRMPATIERWKQQFPNCWWGVDCGKSGLLVVDDDRGKKPKAVKSLETLADLYGELPATFTVRTQSGGRHYYLYGASKNSVNRLGEGLDIRSDGGYVVAPASPGYDVHFDDPIADAPQWLIALCRPAEPPKPAITADVELDTSTAIESARSYLQTVAPAIEGEGGDDHTYRVAAHVKDLGVSIDECESLMAMYFNPRCEPEWSDDELRRKILNAYEYGQNKPGAKSPEAVFTVYEEPVDPSAQPRYKLLTRDDLSSLPPMDWCVKGIVPARGCWQMYGPSTAGKSFLMFDLLAAIAEGRPWFGHKTKPRPVLYVCLEGEAGLRQRAEAWEAHHGRKLPPSFYMLAQSWSIITKKDVTDLAGVTPKNAVVAIDTQNRAAPGVDESASKDMGAILEGARLLAYIIDGSVGLVAHTGKDVSKGVRGHSSQIAAMDAHISVSRRGETRTWTAAKVKDGRDGESHKFGLRVIDLGVDEDGDEVTSCAVDPTLVGALSGAESELNAAELEAWEAAKFLISQNSSGRISNPAWAAQLAKQLGTQVDKALRNSLYRASKKLCDLHLLAKDGKSFVLSALTAVEDED